MSPRERVWFAHAIRGPACLLVVFAHLFDLFPNAQPLVAQIARFEPVAGLPSVPWAGVMRFLARHDVSPGTVGVLLFFLVSGFVIPFSLEHGNPRAFAVRRFFRLYPTLWVCLAVTLALLAVQAWSHGTPMPYGAKTIGANAFLASPYTRLPWIEPVLWSLAVEELFYLVAATAAWRGLLLSRAALVLAAGGLTVLCVVAGRAEPLGPLFWLGFYATYVVFVLIGVVFHHVYRGRWRPAEGLAVGSAVFGLHVLATLHGPAAGVAGVYIRCALIALAVFGGLYALRDRLPYSRLVDGLSNISYPLYLLHAVNGFVLLRAVYVLTGSYYLGAGVAVAASVLAAMAMHRWVEVPTNDFGRRLSRTRGRAPAAVRP